MMYGLIINQEMQLYGVCYVNDAILLSTGTREDTNLEIDFGDILVKSVSGSLDGKNKKQSTQNASIVTDLQLITN